MSRETVRANHWGMSRLLLVVLMVASCGGGHVVAGNADGPAAAMDMSTVDGAAQAVDMPPASIDTPATADRTAERPPVTADAMVTVDQAPSLPYPACNQAAMSNQGVGGCGYLWTDGSWISLYKGGVRCMHCGVAPAMRYTKCTTTGASSSEYAGQPIYCADNCQMECCYQRPGSSCTTDANCCSPLRCVNKACG